MGFKRRLLVQDCAWDPRPGRAGAGMPEKMRLGSSQALAREGALGPGRLCSLAPKQARVLLPVPSRAQGRPAAEAEQQAGRIGPSVNEFSKRISEP